MKDERKQCKKHHESTIGKIIYGFLLFLPLFAIGSACLISTFNMASKEESEIHYKYETNEVNSVDDLIEGNLYEFDINYFWSNYNENDEFLVYNTKVITLIDSNYVNTNKINYYSSYYFYLHINENVIQVSNDEYGYPLIEFEIATNNNQSFLNLNTTKIYLTYNSSVTITGDNLDYHLFRISDYNEIDYVETHNVSAQDVFYDSVDKVQESPLFNWTTNTGIYTVLNNTCNSLGITTTFVPLLLTYWLIISVMYFLYDIVLIILNILHRKIHELQESI